MVRWRRRETISSAVGVCCCGSSTLGLSSDAEDEDRVTGVMYLRIVGSLCVCVWKERLSGKLRTSGSGLSSERCLLIPRNSLPISVSSETKRCESELGGFAGDTDAHVGHGESNL